MKNSFHTTLYVNFTLSSRDEDFPDGMESGTVWLKENLAATHTNYV